MRPFAPNLAKPHRVEFCGFCLISIRSCRWAGNQALLAMLSLKLRFQTLSAQDGTQLPRAMLDVVTLGYRHQFARIAVFHRHAIYHHYRLIASAEEVNRGFVAHRSPRLV